MIEQQYDVAVVGGGLAGLTAATLAAEAGKRVVVFEQGREMGGYARSYTEHGLRFNLGPHALYTLGYAKGILEKLGVPVWGQVVSPKGFKGIRDGRLHALPVGPGSLLTTSLLGSRGRWEIIRLLAGLAKVDATKLRDVSVDSWLGTVVHDLQARQVLGALIRVATYVHDPQRLSAGVAVRQLQLSAQGSVYYLDGGWQSLVDGLLTQARQAGVVVEVQAKVVAVEDDGSHKWVRLDDRRQFGADAVVLATGPAVAGALLQPLLGAPNSVWQSAVPIHMACLNVGLRRLPRPQLRVAFGIDRPLYFSVHSEWAKLAPGGEAVIHVGKYGRPSEQGDAEADERELEAVLDLVQPGWRAELVSRRYLPHMLVANALPMAEREGAGVQADPRVAGLNGVYVVGDWVGSEGWLSDRALTSAERAVQLLLNRRVREQERPAYAIA